MTHAPLPTLAGLRAGLVAACLSLAVAACGGTATTTPTPGQPTAAPPATVPPTASVGPTAAASDGTGAVCPWLTPDDFARFGVDGAGTPTDNPDGPDNHYCVYAGRSGATGGIELDVFFGPDVATAKDTYTTATGEGPGGRPATGFPFDQSSFAVDGEVAYLTVRQDTLVIALAIPNDTNAEAGLVELAKLVIQRAMS